MALLFAVFTSCSNAAGGGLESDSVDPFSSPRALLQSIDYKNTVSSSSRSARSVAADHFESNDTALVSDFDSGTDSSSSRVRLTGERSTSYAILDILNNECVAALGGLEFNTPYTSEIAASRIIEKAPETNITITKLEVRLDENEEGKAYVYCDCSVTKGESKLKTPFVLECTKNELGTVDTRLYMKLQYLSVQSWQDLEVCFSAIEATAGKKVKNEYSHANGGSNYYSDYWQQSTVTSSRIESHSVRTWPSGSNRPTIERTTNLVLGNYSAVYWNSIENGSHIQTIRCMDSNGKAIREKGYDNNQNGWTEWQYYVNFLNIPSGYVIKKFAEENGYVPYKICASAEASDGVECWRMGTYTESDDDDAPEYLQFAVPDRNDNLTTYPCKVDSGVLNTLDDIESLGGEHPHASATSFPNEKSAETVANNSGLPALLTSWLNDE